jgi:hypothetical protein
MFYYRTPREYIEGYYDPLIASLATIPVYLAGDATNSPWLGINLDPLSPNENPVSLFSGSDDYMQTRLF